MAFDRYSWHLRNRDRYTGASTYMGDFTKQYVNPMYPLRNSRNTNLPYLPQATQKPISPPFVSYLFLILCLS